MLYFKRNKIILFFVTLILVSVSFFNTAFGQDPNILPGSPTSTATTVDSDTTYTPLAPLSDELAEPYSTTGTCPLGKYLGILFNFFIGMAAVLAMVMIFVGGIEYMGSELISSKESGISKVKNAIFGLLLALASYLILNEINPKLLNICLGDIPNATVKIEPITEAEQIINSSGAGKCEPVTDPNSKCSPANLASAFPGTTGNPPPFDTLAAQASAVCNGESKGVVADVSMDKCANEQGGPGGPNFSFGLFQINAVAHRNNLPAASGCKDAFSIPAGHGSNQGNQIPGSYSWTCRVTNQAKYEQCKNWLLNPANNIAYAAQLRQSSGDWNDWSAYKSCSSKGKF